MNTINHRIAFCVCLFCIVTGSAYAQDFGYISGGYGMTSFENSDLNLFVETYNEARQQDLQEGFDSFSGASGWGFETAYAYDVENVINIVFATELHTYKENQSATFANGSQRLLGLRLQDLSSSSTFAIKTNRGYLGPVFGTSRRSSQLTSSFEGDGNTSVDNDHQLNGTYNRSNIVLEYGWHYILGHGPIQFQAKALRPFTALYPTRHLADYDSNTYEASYFPSDYQAFQDGQITERRNGISDAFAGWHVRFSLALTFPV